jgi:hypothetical protein
MKHAARVAEHEVRQREVREITSALLARASRNATDRCDELRHFRSVKRFRAVGSSAFGGGSDGGDDADFGARSSWFLGGADLSFDAITDGSRPPGSQPGERWPVRAFR